MEIGTGDTLVVRMALYRIADEVRNVFRLDPVFHDGPSLHLRETELIQAVVDGIGVFKVAERLLADCDIKQRTMLFLLRRFRAEHKRRNPVAVASFLQVAAREALADGLTAIPTVSEFLHALEATSLEATLRRISGRPLRW